MEINWWTFTFEVINFGIIVLVLYKVLYRPVRRIMQERQDAIAAKIEKARKGHEEADALKAEYHQKLQTAEADGAAKRDELVEKGREKAEKIVQEARDDAKKLRASTEASLARQRERSAQELRQKVVDAAAAIASAMGAASDPAAVHEQAIAQIERLLDELDEDAKASATNLLGEGKAVNVRMAPELSEPLQQKLSGILADRLAVEAPKLDVTVDDELIAGIELRIGGLILKANWRDEIDRLLQGDEATDAAEHAQDEKAEANA